MPNRSVLDLDKQRDADASRCSRCLTRRQHRNDASVSRWLSRPAATLLGSGDPPSAAASATEVEASAPRQAPAAHQLVFDLHQSSEPVEPYAVLDAQARLQHARKVRKGRDGWPRTAAEVLAIGANTQVVVPARAPRCGHEAQFARRCVSANDLSCLEIADGNMSPVVGASPVELVDHDLEASEILLSERRDDVQAIRDLATPVHHAREASNHDEAHTRALERREKRVRVEAVALSHLLSLNRSMSD